MDKGTYRDLVVWQRAIQLAKEIYQITSGFPSSEMYGLTSQIRRAAVSVPSNIAEGQARHSFKDFAHFLRIATGSLAEIDTQLVLAQELGYINAEQLSCTEANILEVRRMIYGLMRTLDRP